MRRLLSLITAATLALTPLIASSASAGGYYKGGYYKGGYHGGGYHYRHRNYGYRYGYKHRHRYYGRRHSDGAWAALAVIGTIGLAAAIASADNNRNTHRSAPAPQRYGANGACRVMHKDTTLEDGERVKLAGTMCTDEYGNDYIVPGSEHVIERY